jgi:hypothetical protein
MRSMIANIAVSKWRVPIEIPNSRSESCPRFVLTFQSSAYSMRRPDKEPNSTTFGTLSRISSSCTKALTESHETGRLS